MKRARREVHPGRNDHAHQPLSGAVFSDRALERAARSLRAIGDEGRLRLMAILSKQEACVGEIALTMRERTSTISERLRRLRDAGLVISRRKGKHKYYSIVDDHITELVLNSLSHASEDES
jgi:ArsR family transcriptional regulator, lead/cadmium/zinc/bismuth-responsive transcriptional repressor